MVSPLTQVPRLTLGDDMKTSVILNNTGTTCCSIAQDDTRRAFGVAFCPLPSAFDQYGSRGSEASSTTNVAFMSVWPSPQMVRMQMIV
jgi:hypothetical protein